MTKHTAGPWTVGDGHIWHADEATGMGFRFAPIEFNGGCLAWVASDEGDHEAEPNARLIAAAPELLEACERCIAALQANGAPNCEAAKEARAAIAKARGESKLASTASTPTSTL